MLTVDDCVAFDDNDGIARVGRIVRISGNGIATVEWGEAGRDYVSLTRLRYVA